MHAREHLNPNPPAAPDLTTRSMQSRKKTLLPTLILAVLLLNLAVGGLLAFTLAEAKERKEGEVHDMVENMSLLLDLSVTASVEQIDLSLQEIATQLELAMRHGAGRTPESTDHLLSLHQSRLARLGDLHVTDAEGAILLDRSATPRAPHGHALYDLIAAHRSARDDRLIASRLLADEARGGWVVVFSRGYEDADGALAGLVTATLPAAYFQDRLSGLDLGPGGIALIRDLDMHMVARIPPLDTAEGRIGSRGGSKELVDIVASGVQAQSFYSARTADGIHRINAFRRLSVMPAFVVVGLGEADYLAQWRDDVRKATFLALAFLVVSTLAGWLLWRFISANERASQRSRILLQNASDGIHITDLEGRVIEASDAFCRMLGHPYADLLGMNVSSWDVGQATTTWPQPKGPAPAEAQIRTSETEYRRADGSTMPVEITSYPLELDGRPVVFHSARDISARRKSEEEVRKLAFFDSLTELPNRRLLIQRLGETLSESAGTRVKGALLFIDLDNFKTVNDTAGHYEGDRLLVRVARTLVECVSRNDVVARIGGDEFVVLLARLGTDEGTVTRLADEVARRILNTLATSLGSGDGEYRASASIGVTLFDGEGEESAEAPLVRADVAMFAAKLAGRNTIRFFDPRMQAALSERAELETGLWTALEQRQFFLSYQAQVLASGEVIGLEALLRWRHPQRGLVSPASFIPLAEETGLIVPIGRWVLETACMQLARWAAEPARAGLPISVNVSARQILDDRFVDDVLEVLARTGADPGRLKLELTESSLLVDVEAVIGKMNMLKARGIGFSLDDFGTGYSSLAYLKRLPLEQLKIDQSFVRDILDDANDAEIARLVIMLAASLGLVVVAEGVETEAQREYLAGLGCERYQGYLFARPLPIAELEAFLTERDTVAAVAAGSCAGPEVARAGGRPALRAASTASSR